MTGVKKKLYIASSPVGIFAVDEEGEVVDEIIFEKDADIIARKLMLLRSKELGEEEKKLAEKYGKKYELIFEVEKEGFSFEFPNRCGKWLRANLEKLAKKHGFTKDRKSFVNFMSDVSFAFSKLKLKGMEVEDRFVIHLAETIEELDKAINLLVVRLREWYGMYYPELVRQKENEEIVDYVVEKLYRKEDSIGYDLKKDELEAIRTLAKQIKEMYELREKLKKELERKMKEIMPNTTHVVGAEIAAKLLTLAGGLEKLAKLPSSTIQVLGAEKALFRFLSGKGKSPKHGVIFLTPYIQKVPKKARGKMARKLASKISIAAKLDYFNRERFEGEKLKKELEEEMEKLIKKG